VGMVGRQWLVDGHGWWSWSVILMAHGQHALACTWPFPGWVPTPNGLLGIGESDTIPAVI